MNDYAAQRMTIKIQLCITISNLLGKFETEVT